MIVNVDNTAEYALLGARSYGCMLSKRILGQNVCIQNHLSGSDVSALSYKPEQQHKQTESPRDQGRIIHRRCLGREREWETKDDDEDDDVGA